MHLVKQLRSRVELVGNGYELKEALHQIVTDRHRPSDGCTDDARAGGAIGLTCG